MDITIIPIEVFLGHLPYSGIGKPNVQLQEKAEWLSRTFSCFQESLSEPKKWQRPERTVKASSRPIEKPRIGNRDLSNENLARKDFVSHMNKLSASNKQSIFKHIQQTLRPGFHVQYIQWLWEYMLMSPVYQDLYMDVIPIVATSGGVKQTQDILMDMWNAYCKEKKWVPDADMFDEQQEYDEFCSYLIWKKKAIASIQAWIRLGRSQYMHKHLAKDLFSHLLQSCSEYMHTPSKTLEVLLEQVLHYLAIQQPDILELHSWVDQWKPSFASMSPAIRFKLCDIEEWMQGKSENKHRTRK